MKQNSKVFLQVQNVSKLFPGVRELKNVSLEVRRVEMLALVGENGAGKSTLMKILSGEYSVDEGSIFIEGRTVTIPNTVTSQKLGISATIYQELNTIPNLTVAENVFIREKKKKEFFDQKTINKEAIRLLKMAGLEQTKPTDSVEYYQPGP